MPSEASEEVAADPSATIQTPANEGEETADAERVELAPWTVEAVTRPVVSWADASEEVQPSVSSTSVEHSAEADLKDSQSR